MGGQLGPYMSKPGDAFQLHFVAVTAGAVVPLLHHADGGERRRSDTAAATDPIGQIVSGGEGEMPGVVRAAELGLPGVQTAAHDEDRQRFQWWWWRDQRPGDGIVPSDLQTQWRSALQPAGFKAQQFGKNAEARRD